MHADTTAIDAFERGSGCAEWAFKAKVQCGTEVRTGEGQSPTPGECDQRSKRIYHTDEGDLAADQIGLVTRVSGKCPRVLHALGKQRGRCARKRPTPRTAIDSATMSSQSGHYGP